MYERILHHGRVSINYFVLIVVMLEPISATPLMEQQKVGFDQYL